ncbi:MAG: 30S ribosome-binding factor RbfA [Candidatus Peribacteraceae bacterium]|nr:30S ribosome-binding factor RbfA [Candidatus Peribacteraceae bacterium]
MSHRFLQIAGIIRSVVARHALTIQPNVASMVSITDVRLSSDFSYADISVTALTNVEAAVTALKRGSTQMREEVGKVVTMHKLPMLRFRRDDAIEKGEQIDRLLAQISTPQKKSVRRKKRS